MRGVTPRFSTAVLKALLPSAVRDEALDELRDGYLLRVAQYGRAAANRWYRGQVPGFAIRVRLAILTGGSLEPPTELHVREPSLNGSERMTTILADLRYGARALVRNPAFSLIAVLTLALGIGANAAIFSFVNGILLNPLPYPTADRIVRVLEKPPGPPTARNGISTLNYLDWEKQNHVFEYLSLIHI